MGELPELLNRLLHFARQLIEHLCSGGGIVRDDVARQAQVDGQGHQVLLGAVMEIALDPPPLGVAARHNAGPGLPEGIGLLAQLVERGLERRVELRVVERQAHLARQVREHAVVVLGEEVVPGGPFDDNEPQQLARHG